jgi:hypothetical protein
MDLASLSEKIKKATDDFQREAAEARRVVEQREQAALNFCVRLLAVLHIVLDEKKASLPNRLSGSNARPVALRPRLTAGLPLASVRGCSTQVMYLREIRPRSASRPRHLLCRNGYLRALETLQIG